MDFKKNYIKERGGKFNEIDIEEWILYNEWMELKLEALLLLVKRDRDCFNKIYELDTNIIGWIPRTLIDKRKIGLDSELKKIKRVRKSGGMNE